MAAAVREAPHERPDGGRVLQAGEGRGRVLEVLAGSTRSTELAEKGIPIQDFCRWLGHTQKVALEFDMQVRSASYDRAAASILTVYPSTLRSA